MDLLEEKERTEFHAAMAQQRQRMKVELEDLVDMFLEDKLGDPDALKRVYQSASKWEERGKRDPEDIFGEVVSDGVPCRKEEQNYQPGVQPQKDELLKDQDVARQHLGRSLANAGDQLWNSKKVSVSKDTLQVEILQTGQLSERGEISKEEEEEHWKRFKEMLDKALEDIGPHNPYRMMVSVLVAVRGLSNLGSGVGMLARRFTLRFFEEHRLKRDIERAGGIEFLADENLD